MSARLVLCARLSAAAVLATLFAGCGGGIAVDPPRPANSTVSGAESMFFSAKTQPLPLSAASRVETKHLVYVGTNAYNSAGQQVDIFSRKGQQPIGKINGQQQNNGFDLDVAVDAKQNVYALECNYYPSGEACEVLEYARGSNMPKRIYTKDISPYDPADAVSKDGVLFVGEHGDTNYGILSGVWEFPSGTTEPSQFLAIPASTRYNANGLAVDTKGNLFVGAVYQYCPNYDCTGAVYEFRHKSTVPIDLGLQVGGGPYAVAFDKTGNLVVGQTADGKSWSIEVFQPGSKKASRVIRPDIPVYYMAFAPSGKELYISELSVNDGLATTFEGLSYPSGKVIEKVSVPSGVNGIAVTPALFSSW